MKKSTLVIVFLVTYACAHAVVYLSAPRSAGLVRDVVFTFLPLVLGLLLAAVGIFLGALPNVYQLATVVRDPDSVAKIVGSVNAVVREVRHNTLFSLVAFAAIVLDRFLSYVDIPGVCWPVTYPLFAKSVVLDSVAIALAALVGLAIFDCTRAMFTLQSVYDQSLASTKALQ